MQPLFEHPSEDALERFLLHQSPETELETLEAHVLACPSCVARLEMLETQIAATKVALRELQAEAPEKASGQKHAWKSWFRVPALSFAGAAAVVALCIAAFLPAQVNLSAQRGTEMAALAPEWRPLAMHLNANDLADGPVTVQVVNRQGTEIWNGTTLIRHEQAEVSIGRMTESGTYLLRLYEPARQGQTGDLLREYTFRVK